jgi:hypothetical protein
MRRGGFFLAVGFVALFSASRAWGQTAPPLGAAQSFAVLAASTVTNTGPTTISGDLGVSPGTAVTGFPPGTVVPGPIHSNDSAATAAQGAVTTAYDNLTAQACTQTLSAGQDLGGMTLTPGVYCSASTLLLTTVLTLDAQGDPNAVFIFKMGSALTTASGSSVVMIGNGSACNVFWQLGSSATLGTNTAMLGNILATASITANTGVTLTGRAFARNGAVTLDTNAVTAPCAVTPPVCPTITMSPSTLPNGTATVAYSQTIVGSGGATPYAFAVTVGTLPAGLTLSSAGVLSGTPTTAGPSTFTIRATDANDCVGSTPYSITIAAAPPPVCPTVTLAPGTLPGGTVDIAYAETLTGSGGAAPYLFSVTAGTLPAGLTLTSAGVLSGTPTSSGPASFTIRATDTNTCFASVAYIISIAAAPPPPPVCPVITLAPTTLPGGTVGIAYSQTITGTGGIAPYGFGVTIGALPAGLTLTGAGVLAGTPTAAGTVTFTVRGSDANGCFATISLTIVIAPSPPPPPVCPTIALAPSTLPNGTVAVAYTRTITASGGVAPYSFGVTAGALSDGFTLTSAGILAGTPTVVGTSAFTIRGTDVNGCVAQRAFTLTVPFIPIVVPFMPPSGLGILAVGLIALGYVRMRRPIRLSDHRREKVPVLSHRWHMPIEEHKGPDEGAGHRRQRPAP